MIGDECAIVQWVGGGALGGGVDNEGLHCCGELDRGGGGAHFAVL